MRKRERVNHTEDTTNTNRVKKRERWIRKESQNDRKGELPNKFSFASFRYIQHAHTHKYILVGLFTMSHRVFPVLSKVLFLVVHLSGSPSKQRFRQVDLIDMKIRVKLSSPFLYIHETLSKATSTTTATITTATTACAVTLNGIS